MNVAADRSWSLCLVDLLHGGEADLCRHTGARFFPTSLVSGMPVEDQVRCDVEGPLRVLVELWQVADDGTVLFTVHAVVHATDLVLGRTRERLVSLVPDWTPTTTQTTQTTWTATQVKPHGY